MTTPFDAVTGEVAPVSFRENLRRWLASPVDGIVLFGSTGEGVLLDMEEKEQLLGFARDVVPPETALVAGAGAESTRETILQCKRLAAAGAEAILLHTAPYFGALLSPAAIRDHYLAVAEASPVPLIVYHIPKFTRVVLEPGLVGELARHANIVALKDSSGDLKRFAEYTDVCARGSCNLLIGNGAMLYTALELGAAGGIVALGVLAAASCAELYRLYQAGEGRRAGQLQERLAPVHKEIVARLGAPGIKAALDLLGFHGGPPRPPLAPIDDKTRRRLARVMQDAKIEVVGQAS